MSTLPFKPSFKSRTLSFERIKGDIEGGLYQVRDFTVDGHRASLERSKSRAHVEELIKVIKQGGKLDPIIVNPHSEEYGVQKEKHPPFYIVDGHHRLRAYTEAYERGHMESKQIRVKVLQNATPEQARGYAFRHNQKAHLNMTEGQRTQEAWETLWRQWDRFKDLSVRRTAEGLGGAISKSLADGMKKAIEKATTEDEYLRKQLNNPYPQVDPWKTFRRKYEPNGKRIDREERKAKARIYLEDKMLRLAERSEWHLLEDEERLELVGILMGKPVYLEKEPKEEDW